MTMKRRAFLKGVAAATTGLIIGFRFEPRGIAGLALATEGKARAISRPMRSSGSPLTAR